MTRDRYFFIHLQKTGGTALLARLRRAFGPRAIYPIESDGGVIERVLDSRHLIEAVARRDDEIRVITGHYPLAVLDAFDETFRTFTLLREPVARTMSFLRHQHVLDPTTRDRSLEDLYEDPRLFDGLIHDHMTKMLSLDHATTMTAGMVAEVTLTDADLEAAKTNVESIDVVGIQEDYETFIGDLEQTFGWDLGDPVFANRTTPTDEEPDLADRIRSDNAYDVALYDHVRARLATRSTP